MTTEFTPEEYRQFQIDHFKMALDEAAISKLGGLENIGLCIQVHDMYIAATQYLSATCDEPTEIRKIAAMCYLLEHDLKSAILKKMICKCKKENEK